MVNGKTWKTFPLKSTIIQGLPNSLAPFNTGLETQASTTREDKGLMSSKLARRVSVCVDQMMIYLRGKNKKTDRKKYENE